jgi:hypothetical protein
MIKVQSDTKEVFLDGIVTIVKILLKVKDLNEKRDSGFIINQIFIDELILWI